MKKKLLVLLACIMLIGIGTLGTNVYMKLKDFRYTYVSDVWYWEDTIRVTEITKNGLGKVILISDYSIDDISEIEYKWVQ